MLRWLLIAGGFAMVGVGVLGWLLPLMPGWPFVIAGLVILGREFHWARRTLGWLKTRHPKKAPQA